EGARRLMGAPMGAAPPRFLHDILLCDLSERPLDPQELPAARALCGESLEGLELALVVRSTGYRRFVRISAAPIRDPEGRLFGAVLVASDITEQVEFNRLKDQFISIAAHELNTPVAVMKGYAQAVLRGTWGVPPGVRAQLQAINRGSERI